MRISRKIKKSPEDAFQQETEYQRERLPVGYLDLSSKPDTYKRYSSAPKVRLDPPERDDGALLLGDHGASQKCSRLER